MIFDLVEEGLYIWRNNGYKNIIKDTGSSWLAQIFDGNEKVDQFTADTYKSAETWAIDRNNAIDL